MNKLAISDIDIIFISYDEPNADKNYADLLNKAPWAKRVHGVHGSDTAHKASAQLSDTDRFVSVDADNIVDEKFFHTIIDLDSYNTNTVFSWAGKNIVNGLIYGNGGLKCWPKNIVLNMKTHENSDSDDVKTKIEFCWNSEYVQQEEVYSTSYINASALQAFRSGFREGVKMSLDQGTKVKKENIKTSLYKKNYQRLCIWQSVGSDVKNGNWAIYGARLGCYMVNCTDWDYINVRDFSWINNYFSNNLQNISDEKLQEKILQVGNELRLQLNIDICELDSNQSKFFKQVYVNPPRMDN
jgi:hypothetical protein